MSRIKVLLVEDEASLSQLIYEVLTGKGFEVTRAANGLEGWSLYKNNRPDIAVVDVMLPGKDGLSLVKDIRASGDQLPILILTARTAPADVIRGLESGADDYVKKPFSIEELMLRIRILVRRTNNVSQGPPALMPIGRYIFNHKRLELTIGEQTVRLSQIEADLLHLLVQKRSQVLERDTALNAIWGDNTFFNGRSMDVYITRLRKFLSQDPYLQIVNVRGKGYRLID